MNTLRSFLVLSATAVMVVLGALPALATEAEGKSQLITRSLHHQVGAVILLVFSLLVVAGMINAYQQLSGKRRQADGKFRWR